MAHSSYGELRQLFETFTRVWGAGGQASLHLHTQDGKSRATLNLELGLPADPRPGAPVVQGEGPGLNHGPQHHLPPCQQRPRRRGPAARARDAARRTAWLQEKQQQGEAGIASSETDTVICPDTETVSAASTDSNNKSVEMTEEDTSDSNTSDVIPQLDGPVEATLSITPDDEVMEDESLEEEVEPDIFKMADNGWPEVKQIAPGVIPPEKVLHPELGIGDNPTKIERHGVTWFEYTFWQRGVGYIERDMYHIH